MKKKNYIIIIKKFLFLNNIYFKINKYKSKNFNIILNKNYYLKYKIYIYIYIYIYK
ncbi:hypothetical protein [Candidatus Carsonella ruddii]|uniref:Uncharacterized protein n=1 Tax=Candidatus Carsonella ruddii HC isolate Thao2000 TaxID=1202538 RepID=J3VPQ6_CARRU|nr:hypothetical protein [Candidatus Carsonella ruddii]AFP83871.1 hypothetical protein A353_016 [Candidatus Carsonella ruddii HC isolate Thao2000]